MARLELPNEKSKTKIFVLLGGLLFAFILIPLVLVRTKTIDGHQRGVAVSWIGGVKKEPIQPGGYWYCPMITTLHIADVGQQRFVMNDEPMHVEKHSKGREKDRYVIQSSDNQPMTLTIEVLWHRDPAKVVQQQGIGDVANDELFVENVLRTPVRREAKAVLSIEKAIDVYSGVKHVKAIKDIEAALIADRELIRVGCIIDGVTIDMTLDPKFVEPILQRQIAIQEQLAAVEKERAAEAQAKVAKALAQADLNTQVVAAERDKQVAVTKAEQLQASTVLAAEGEKKKVVLEGEARAEAAKNEAAAILAKGEATAAAAKLQYAAYESPGGKVYAQTQIAESMAKAYSGVRGFIPEKMTLSTFADSFQKGVGLMVNPASGAEAK